MSRPLKQKGDLLLNQGKASEAILCYQQAVQQNPDYAEAFNNLGIAFKHQNRLNEAIACYRRALHQKPDYAAAWNNLANAVREQGNVAEAKRHYQRALELKPDFAEVLNNLGNVLMEEGQLEEASLKFRTALQIKPDYAEAHNNYGNVLQEQKKNSAAIHSYQAAIKFNSRYYKAFSNLGSAYQKQGRLHQALVCYQKAIELNPDYVEAHNNAGNALVEFGKIPQAISHYEKALEINPAYRVAHSNLLLALQYKSDVNLAIYCEVAKNWWQQHAVDHNQLRMTDNVIAERKRWKVGYVSPDFRQHSVSFFFMPLLFNHDRRLVEVYCYSAGKSPDDVTDQIKVLCDHWRPIVGRDDRSVAEQVRRDGIDILVDLAGHTAENRLLVFAYKPAPLQVTWLGYPDTTGMPVIDYRFSDDIADPPGESDTYHSETIVRLADGFLCYGPPQGAPDVSALPAAKNGFISFGSFNNLPKINAEVIALWSRLLHRVAGSRLLLKSKQFADEQVRQRFWDLFCGCGIGAERILLLPRVASTAGHLALYHQVDIALDPFPYNGTTTTCEALWMGVPVITLCGNRHAGRVGASILTRIGLAEMVAKSQDQYIRIGMELAQDIDTLESLRAGLRGRMQASVLCDGKSFAHTMENTFKTLWAKAQFASGGNSRKTLQDLPVNESSG